MRTCPAAILILFFLASTTTGIAQLKKGDVNVRINLLSFLEPNAAGPVVGIEYFVTKNISIGSDAGLIFYNPYIIGDTNVNRGHPFGFRVKPEIRYYINRKEKRKARFFVALEGIWLKTKTTLYNDINVRDNTGNTVYTYTGGYDEIKKTAGGALKFGIQLPFGFASRRLMTEFYLGIGIKNKHYTYERIPAGGSIPERAVWAFSTTRNGTYPTLPAGVKFVWRL